MADQIEIVPRDAPKAGPNSSPQRHNMSQVSVTFDADTGRSGIVGEAPPPQRARPSDLLAKHQARLDAARGEGPPAEEVTIAPGLNAPSPPPPLPPKVDLEEPSPEADASAEAAPADGEQPADDAEPPVESTEGEQPEAEPEPEAKGEDPQYRFELEQARNELAAMRAKFEGYSQGRRKEEFEDYFYDPVAWLKSKVAEVLDAKGEDPIVGSELSSLLGELTWHSVGMQDLPEAQQSQLRGDRHERKSRLDQHTRQTARRASQVSQEADAARNFTRSVYETVKDKFPAAALAEHRYGRPIQELILARLPQWLESGQIRGLESKSSADLITEAIRLFDLDSRQWAQNLSPQLAHLNPAAVPATPGASSQPAAAKAPVKPQAGQKAPPVKPRTLPQKQAGAAPSRPAVAPQQQEEPLSRDPEKRREQILKRADERRRR